MKKVLKIIIIVVGIILLFKIYEVDKVFYKARISIKEKLEIKEYVQNYLTNKYGEHKYKFTDIEYDMSTLFDYSHSIRYNENFKSDIVR